MRLPLAPALAAALLFAPGPERACAGVGLIEFDAESCELGSLTQGEQPGCVFAFRNAGGGDLQIIAVEPTCGCTTARLAVTSYRPGERGRIEAAFDSTHFAGEVEKEIVVRSSDPGRPAVTLRVKARVEPEIDFEPRQVVFDGVRPGVTVSQEVVLTNRRAEAVALSAVRAEPSAFSCVVPAWRDPASALAVESWDRLVVLASVAPPGTLSMPLAGECTFAIAGPRLGRFTLKLLALPAAR